MIQMESLQNLRAAYQQILGQERADGHGKIYSFIAPTSNMGTSYVARNMALIAGETISAEKQICLIDMDIRQNTQSNWFFSEACQMQYGAPQGPYDVTFSQKPFWRITPSVVNDQGQNIGESQFMSLHTVPSAKLAFTHFHWEQVRQGQNVHIQNSRSFWHALRTHFAAVFVDVPALDRADILSAICTEMDTNVLVSTPDHAHNPALGKAYKAITDLGARCGGVVFNVHSAPVAYGKNL